MSSNFAPKSQQLTLELLRAKIPTVKQGKEAFDRLNSEEAISPSEKRKLIILQKQGNKAQEELLYAALPLIKSIASKEFQRRRNWSSRVSYDDIMQEAMIGFIRGLQSFKIDATNVSPTNYLGQWITVSIRRKVESMDHDFTIPYEMVERHRRIRAVRARISTILEREPTDEELLEALNAMEQDGAVYKWGKVNKDSNASRSKKFTQKHIDEYRETLDKTYGLTTYEIQTDDNDDGFYETEATSLFENTAYTTDTVDRTDLASSQYVFFNHIFIEMKIGSKQKDVILRYFGLEPYSQPQLQKEIILNTGLPSKYVKTVLEAFTMYMPLKGGVFHKNVLLLDEEKIHSLELSWIVPILGEWPLNQKEPIAPPEILTQTGLTIKHER